MYQSILKLKFYKKIFLCAFAVFAFAIVDAQIFGAKAGVKFASNKVEFEGVSATGSETGFYVGVFAQIELSEKFAFQPSAGSYVFDCYCFRWNSYSI